MLIFYVKNHFPFVLSYFPNVIQHRFSLVLYKAKRNKYFLSVDIIQVQVEARILNDYSILICPHIYGRLSKFLYLKFRSVPYYGRFINIYIIFSRPSFSSTD